MKQTAVDWLEEFLKDRYTLINSEAIFQHAKKMEKEQIMQTLNDGKEMAIFPDLNKSLEEYYKETYTNK